MSECLKERLIKSTLDSPPLRSVLTGSVEEEVIPCTEIYPENPENLKNLENDEPEIHKSLRETKDSSYYQVSQKIVQS